MPLKKIIPLLLLSGLFFASCAEELEESDESIQRRILSSYLLTNYQNKYTETPTGLVILDSKPGTGDVIKDSTYILLRYTSSSLSGDYASYTFDSIAKQLGTYSKTNYYHAIRKSVYGMNDGLSEAIIGQKVGCHFSLILPPWLKSWRDTRYNAAPYETSYRYDIWVDGVTDDIGKYQIDELEEYAAKYHEGLDSTYYGLYFKSIIKPEDTDTISNSATISLLYVGKYLDGQIFDTNIADSAKKYNIYSGNESSYSALSFTFSQDSTSAIDNNSSVKGFSLAVSKMRKYGEECVTFFNSGYGYGDDGSLSSTGKGIPPFMPLLFDIRVVDKDDD